MGSIDDCPKLAILVPYRDRKEHLREFVPCLEVFLATRMLPGKVSIHIVEQSGHCPFNRGKLLNCGFKLVEKEVDYIVFHDVDYIPEEADYSFTSQPTRLIWHGLVLREDYRTFFGAVCGMSCDDFLKINGFSNKFWHWGCEDIDLRFRLEAAGLVMARRDGIFRSLSHTHNGFDDTGKLKPEVIPNFKQLQARWAGTASPDGRETANSDGLSSLSYTNLLTIDCEYSTGSGVPVWHHLVDLGQPDGI